MKNIKNLLFDFGNVLIDIDIPKSYSAIESIPGINISATENLFRELHWSERYEVGNMTEESFFNAFQRMCKPVPQHDVLIDAWNAMLIGIPSSRLEKLLTYRKWYKIYLLSNTNTTHLRWVYKHLVERHGVVDFDSRYFDKTYYSHLIKLRKPSLESFQFVLDDAQILAHETLFIDDMKSNIDIASSMGFQTIHHDPSVDIFDTLDKQLI